MNNPELDFDVYVIRDKNNEIIEMSFFVPDNGIEYEIIKVSEYNEYFQKNMMPRNINT